jgi:hypothetical protein
MSPNVHQLFTREALSRPSDEMRRRTDCERAAFGMAFGANGQALSWPAARTRHKHARVVEALFPPSLVRPVTTTGVDESVIEPSLSL